MSELTLWYTRCPIPTALGLAAQNGLIDQSFADKHEINVCSLREAADEQVRNSHYTHTQPGSFRHGGSYPAIWARANGADTRVIGLSTMPASTPQTILTLSESALHAAADLKGRRILLLRRPQAVFDFHYFNSLRTLDMALASTGLTRADVTIVEHVATPGTRQPDGPAKQRDALLLPATLFPLVRGEVDAIIAGVTRALDLRRNFGLRKLFDQADLPLAQQGHNGRPLTLTVDGALVRDRPDIVRRLLGSVLQAERSIAADPQAAVLRYARDFAISEQVSAHLYGGTLIDDVHVDFRADRTAALQNEVDFLFAAGAIPRRFDVETWLVRDFLAELRGEAGTHEPAPMFA
ncbi:MAG: hypothetical protein QM690_18460 [Sphingobium sp.]